MSTFDPDGELREDDEPTAEQVVAAAVGPDRVRAEDAMAYFYDRLRRLIRVHGIVEVIRRCESP